jgi:hypothetical protein
VDKQEALDCVTEVTVSASKKKQLDQYEPIEGHSSFTATVPEGADPEEVEEALNELVWDAVEENVMERWERYVRKSD